MRRARLLLLAVPALLGIVAPARAADPTVLVAAHADGGLVKVTLTGRVAQVTPLVAAAPRAYHLPTQANGASVAFVTETESNGADVSVVDATTGNHRRLSWDGRSGFLLVSRDGRYRYVLRTSSGTFFQLVRIDARNAVKTLLTLPAAAFRKGEVVLSGASLSADGRTVYVARTYESRASDVLAVDTTTGAQRVVQTGARWVHHVVASPDGKWLAVSFLEDDFISRVRLVPLGSGTPKDLTLPYGDIFASAFSPDSSTLVLSSFVTLTPEEVTPGLHLADVATGLVLPVAGTESVFQAVAVA